MPITFAQPAGAAEPRRTERWIYDRDTGRVENEDGNPVLYVSSSRMDSLDVQGGAGRATRTGCLAAAGPDMLDMLRQYRDDMLHPNLDEGQRERRIETIKALIRKAEGRL